MDERPWLRTQQVLGLRTERHHRVLANTLAVLFSFSTGVVFLISLSVGEAYQRALFIILTGLSAAFCVVWLGPIARDERGRIDVFHPCLLFTIFYLTYFLGSAAILVLLNDYQSFTVNLGDRPGSVVNKVLVLGVISVASFGVGMRLRGKPNPETFFGQRQFRPKVVVYFVAIGFLAVGLAAKLYLLSMYGSISVDFLQFLSPGARRDVDLNISQGLIILGSMADWGCLLYLFTSIAGVYRKTGPTRGSVFAWILLFSVALISFLISGKRSNLFMILFPFIWLNYVRTRFSLPKAALGFVIGIVVIAVGLMVRIVVPLVVSGLNPPDFVGSNFGEMATFYLSTLEFSTFDMVTAAFVHRDEILNLMGNSATLSFLRYTFGTLIVVIPRALWPAKPLYEDPGHVFSKYLLGNEGVGLAVTVWGTSYLFFHIVGVVVGFLLLGWLAARAYATISPVSGNSIATFIYAIFYWMFFQFLRFGTLGFTILYFFQAIMVGLVAIVIVTRSSRQSKQPFLPLTAPS